MGKEKIDEYKILIDIYYKEITLIYTKVSVFTTLQLGVLTGVFIKYNDIASHVWAFPMGICFAIILSLLQILITRRGYVVSQSIISTIAKFEKDNGFSLLKDFNTEVEKHRRFKKMNLPSYLFIFLGYSFFITWVIILFIFISGLDWFKALFSNISAFYGQCEWYILALLSILYAVFMKIADLMDEHGLRWFKGDSIIFGILCGSMGCLLILCDPIIANIIFAMVMGFVVRKRIDYPNHILAFIMLTSCFFLKSHILVKIYFPFLATILVLGFVKDLKYLKKKTKLVTIICKIYLYVPIIYAVPALIYSIITGDWRVFMCFFLYDLAYNITRLLGEKKTS